MSQILSLLLGRATTSSGPLLYHNTQFVTSLPIVIRCPCWRDPGDEIIHPVKAGVKIRLKHRAAPAEIRPLSPGRRCLLLFDEPQLSIAPGQAAVFYEGDIVLGGGIIQSGSSSYAH